MNGRRHDGGPRVEGATADLLALSELDGLRLPQFPSILPSPARLSTRVPPLPGELQSRHQGVRSMFSANDLPGGPSLQPKNGPVPTRPGRDTYLGRILAPV